MDFKGSIVITDPVNIIPANQLSWFFQKPNEFPTILGFTNYHCYTVGVYDSNNTEHIVLGERNERLGNFNTKSNMLGIFLLDEVIRFQPTFDYHIFEPWNTFWIENFDGEIVLVKNKQYLDVYGKGNKYFRARSK